MIGFSRMKFNDPELYDCMAQGITRLCDEHTSMGPKVPADVCFPYTCLNGHRVDADSFRIFSLVLISQAFLECRASSPHVNRCFVAMDDYVKRSKMNSPRYMLELGDEQKFAQKMQ